MGRARTKRRGCRVAAAALAALAAGTGTAGAQVPGEEWLDPTFQVRAFEPTVGPQQVEPDPLTGGYLVGYGPPDTHVIKAIQADGSDAPRFAAGASELRLPGGPFEYGRFAVLADGSIVRAYVIDPSPVQNARVIVEKLRPDGTPDPAFDSASASFDLRDAVASTVDTVEDVKVAPDGFVYVSGTDTPDGVDSGIYVAKIGADGIPPLGFGNSEGVERYEVPTSTTTFGAKIDFDSSRIYIVGSAAAPGEVRIVVFGALQANGNLSVSFEGDGIYSRFFGGVNRTFGGRIAVRGGAQPELFILGRDDASPPRMYVGRLARNGTELQMGPPTGQRVSTGSFQGDITTTPTGDVYVATSRPRAGGGSEVVVDRLAPGGANATSPEFGLNGAGAPVPCGDVSLSGAAATAIVQSSPGDRVVVAAACGPDATATVMRATGRQRFGTPSFSAFPPTLAPGRQRVDLAEMPFTAPIGEDTGETIQSAPFRSSPFRSSPFRSSPFRSSPFRSSPFRSSPFRSSALPPILLSQIPLEGTTWEDVLRGTALEGAPPNTVTLQRVFALEPEPPGLAELKLDQVDLTQTPLRDASVASILLGQVPLDKLPAPPGGWCDFLAPQQYDCGNGVQLDRDTLLSLELNRDTLDAYLARPLPLRGGNVDLTASTLFTFALVDIELKATPIGALPSSALGGLLACTPNCRPTVAEAQAADPDAFSDATLGELVREAVPQLAGLTLGDMLPGLLAPADLPFEQASTSEVLDAAPISSDGAATYAHALRLDCSLAADLRVEVTLPAGARRIPDAATVQSTGIEGGTQIALQDHPDSTDSLAVFTATANRGTLAALCEEAEHVGTPFAGDLRELAFRVRVEPGARLGDTGPSTVRATTRYAQLTAAGQSLLVTDADDPGPDAATAKDIDRSAILSGYIADDTDIDAYKIDAPPVGSKVSVQLTNLPADYDLTITGPPTGVQDAPFRSSPFRSSPFRSSALGLPDDSAEPSADADRLPPDGLQDAPFRSSPFRSSPFRSSSINRSLGTESASFTVTEEDAGQDLIAHITGFNGATSPDPYLLRVEVTPPEPAPQCIAGRNLPSAPRGAFPTLPLPANTRTLVLVNQRRLAQLYPTANIPALRTALNAYAARADVGGVVVPIESDTTVDTDAAYATWDASPCSVEAANGVVAAVNKVVDHVAAGLNDLKHIVVVGGDEALPSARVADLVSLSNETTYADSLLFGGRETATSAAARAAMILTDDAYGDFDPQAWTGGKLFVPDVALGRLVETPQEILGQLQQYATANGRLNPTSAFVAGYDFLRDGAQSVTSGLGMRFGGAPATRIDESWTAADVRAQLTRTTPTVTSINAHYDHHRALPAAAFAGGVPDLLRAGQVGPAAGSILFTMGCHAGLSVVDVGAPNAAPEESARLLDWPQLMGRRNAVYVANTGYGYGDTEAVALSERVMSLYAGLVGSGRATAAQALLFAKQQYATEPTPMGVYDAKSLQEAVFYGLPTYRIGATGAEAPTALPDNPAPGGPRQTSAVSISPTLTPHVTDRGRFWSVGSEVPQTTHSRPLQPRTQVDVTAPDGKPVHGVLIEGLEMDVVENVDPVYARPTIDLAVSEPEQPARLGVFPASLARVDRLSTVDGRRDVLTIVPGQFEATRTDGSGTQRLFKRVDAQVHRSGSADWDPPTMGDVDGEVNGGQAVFSVRTPDDDVTRGVVLYRDENAPNIWKRTELVSVGGGVWRGSGPVASGATRVEAFVVQLLDSAGNVGTTSNKGPGYIAEGVAEPPLGAPKLVVTPERPASGFHRGPVTVTLDPADSSDARFDVTIDQAAAFEYTGPFEVSGDGLHTITVAGSDGSLARATVFIDATLPTITGTINGSPSPEGWYGKVTTVTWACEDATSQPATCPAATSVATQGANQTITSSPGSDRAGNEATGSVQMSVDLGDPAATINGAGGLMLTIGRGARLTGRASDALAGVRSLRVSYSPQLIGASTTVNATVTCSDASRRSCTWSATLPQTLGIYRATAVATDRASRSQPSGATHNLLIVL